MNDKNPLTEALEVNKPIFSGVIATFKEMGKMPYGQVPATPKEQREAFNKLTPKDMQVLIQKYGKEAVNEYIRKMMEG